MKDTLYSLLQNLWQKVPIPLRRPVYRVLESTYTVGVSGVVFNNRGEILVLRHRFREQTGWELPGGFVHGRERLEGALIRELREETGLEVVIDTLISAEMDQRRHIDVCYACHITGGELGVDEREITEVGFFLRENLRHMLPPKYQESIDIASERRDA